MIRKILGIVCIVLGVVGLGAGLSLRTFLAPVKEHVATVAVANSGPLLVIDPGVLTLGSSQATLVVKASDPATVLHRVVAKPQVIANWVGNTQRTEITGATSWTALTANQITGDATTTDIANADLFGNVETATGTITVKVQAAEDPKNPQTILIATDGTAPLTATTSITWPNEASTTGASIFMGVGASLLIIGIVILIVRLPQGQKRPVGRHSGAMRALDVDPSQLAEDREMSAKESRQWRRTSRRDAAESAGRGAKTAGSEAVSDLTLGSTRATTSTDGAASKPSGLADAQPTADVNKAAAAAGAAYNAAVSQPASETPTGVIRRTRAQLRAENAATGTIPTVAPTTPAAPISPVAPAATPASAPAAQTPVSKPATQAQQPQATGHTNPVTPAQGQAAPGQKLASGTEKTGSATGQRNATQDAQTASIQANASVTAQQTFASRSLADIAKRTQQYTTNRTSAASTEPVPPANTPPATTKENDA